MSAILSADDLNDFISPGVACIKPIETLPTAPPPQASESLEFEVILDGQQPSASQPPGPAQISLTDCLACSGCVTSAEAVLVSLQSHNEVLSLLDSAPSLALSQDGTTITTNLDGNPSSKLFVCSVSPQVLASLAAAIGNNTTQSQAANMITHLLSNPSLGLPSGGRHNNGFTYIVSTNRAREASLVLGADEAISSSSNDIKKPVLTSSCPGWVCYAEKTHPYVLPYLSKVKSPQALTGTLLKTTLSKTLNISPDRIWHLSIMPCFDKKLEASREELTDAVWNNTSNNPATTTTQKGIRDVDCVITTKEILMLAESRNINFFSLPTTPLPQTTPFPHKAMGDFLLPFSAPGKKNEQQSLSAGTSGGNLHYILHALLSQNPGSTLTTTRGRNADVIEYSILSSSGEQIFKAARYYGFRNIQNLVRKLKPARPPRMPGGKPFGSARRPGKAAGATNALDFSYVEVMACPGGCTNGGGQLKVDDPIVLERMGFGGIENKPGPQEQKAWLEVVDEAYFSGDDEETSSSERTDDGLVVAGISPGYVRDVLRVWSELTSVPVEKLAYTTFREVVSDVGKTQTDTERVVQLAGKIGGGW
ncbi:Cytosolic Fe-S cluster assembly factor nar1 [Podospora pseudopauciseta]|uniref:Nuclear architecture-related protein 1 n=1 Tax=Podospora pseudopauciseta TaxID=2093780 RepID=A0ABR0HYF5_9PEZI|nr:Cytosolic Fe-S cluster assembly factor nar1 [Podospora pseudopauciseta]